MTDDHDGLSDAEVERRAAVAQDELKAIDEAAGLRHRLDRLSGSQPGLVKAVAAVARLCEAIRREPAGAYMPTWFLRREALAIAAGEGLASDEAKFLALAAGDPHELTSKAEWTSADILRGLETALALDLDKAQPGDLVEVWNATEKSNRRLDLDKIQWKLEQDAEVAAAELARIAASRSPAGAAEVMRSLLTGTKAFDGRGRRIALVLAPGVIRMGYGAPRALIGLAGPIARSPAAFAAASGDEEDFAAWFNDAVAAEARKAMDALTSYARIESDLRRMLPPGRSTGRTHLALQAIIRSPMLTAGEISRQLGATRRGGQIILDRLVSSGIAAPLDPSRSKGRLYVCRRAMNV